MLCRICMDRSLDTALFPCGHAVACLDCARRCERCPLCRADIDHCRTIYLPIELTHVDKHNPKLLSESIEPNYGNSSTEEIQKRSLAAESSVVNGNDIWERRCTEFHASRTFFSRTFACRIERTHWLFLPSLLSYCLCFSLLSYSLPFDLRQNPTHRPFYRLFPYIRLIRTTIDFSFFFFRSFQRRRNANDLSPPWRRNATLPVTFGKPDDTTLFFTEPVQRRIIRTTRSCSLSTLPRSNNKSLRGFVRREFSRSGINWNFLPMNLVRINKLLLLHALSFSLYLSFSRLNTYLQCNCNNVTRYMYTS